MSVDAHVHVWDLAVRDQPWTANLAPLRRSFALDDLGPSLRACGVDGVVLVQTVSVATETPELLSLAMRDPRVAGVVGWVDLCDPGVAGALARLRALPGGDRLVGIRHGVQDEPDPEWLRRREVRRGLAAVADAGLVYDLVVRPPQLPAVLSTVRALPQLRFVLDHGAKPDLWQAPAPEWTRAIMALGTRRNVAAKLSGLVGDAGAGWTRDLLEPFAATLCDSFGSGRLMFGSDWPVCMLGDSYNATFAAMAALAERCAPGRRDDIFDGAARAVYGLGG